MSLEKLDVDKLSKLTKNVKSTLWQASLKHHKDQILENISFNLKLKAAKKSQKITDAYLNKQKERQMWVVFNEQIRVMIPEGPLKAQYLETQQGKIALIEKELAALHIQIERAGQIYKKQFSTAAKIVPELKNYLVDVLGDFKEDQLTQSDESPENLNFYANFNSDLLSYKIVRWFSNGGKTCYTGTQDTFKLYPEIGVLTVMVFRKINDLNIHQEVRNTYIESQIKKLTSQIDILFTLQKNQISAEGEAYKKLHKFQLLNNIAKALVQLKVCDITSPMFINTQAAAIGEVEDCLAIKEPIPLQVRLTAAGVYAL